MDGAAIEESARSRTAFGLSWLTPAGCRLILLAYIVFGFLAHLHYLTHDCPIDLSADEAQYWDWSRQLDLSYYSKGPIVAYLIHGSCALFGNTMPAVRLPALVLAAGTTLVTYCLTALLFGSEKLALGAVLLFAVVPLFIAGSVLMTIDPPMFFCWALATWLAALVLLRGREKLWPLIGLVVGVGFLAKYAMLLWLPTMLLFVIGLEPACRHHLRRPGPWIATAIALLCTAPVVIWNARHGWVSLWHVSAQTGAAHGAGFSPGSALECLAGQIGLLGPGMVVMMAAAVLYALRGSSPGDPNAREMRFLARLGVPFFIGTMLMALRTKVQGNWPAPAYFTLMILTAYFISTRWRSRDSWRKWRWWFYPTVVVGLVLTPYLHRPGIAYPLVPWLNAKLGSVRQTLDRHPESAANAWLRRRLGEKPITARHVDFTGKLQGWRELGQCVAAELREMGVEPRDALVLCDEYQQAAEVAFYTEGRPKTCYAGSYYTEGPTRLTQYDVWPDRSLDLTDRPDLLGRDALFVGYMHESVRRQFARVDKPKRLDIVRGGLKIGTFYTWRCYGFKGLKRPPNSTRF